MTIIIIHVYNAIIIMMKIFIICVRCNPHHNNDDRHLCMIDSIAVPLSTNPQLQITVRRASLSSVCPIYIPKDQITVTKRDIAYKSVGVQETYAHGAATLRYVEKTVCGT